ncbi:MAG: YcaO-like family protein [Methylobacterium mesophilicum]|nr:YcaO-like family protein [Methylobacterium mesophilicum]
MPPQGLPSVLPDAVRAYLAALPAGQIVAFPLASLDRTGVAAWKVSLFLDDRSMPGNMPSGYGYGLDDDQALTGAFGELAESILPTIRALKEPLHFGSYHELKRQRGETGVADPLTLCLPAGSPVTRDTALAWTTATRLRTGEPVLVPVDIAGNDVFELPDGYKTFTTLITNGFGAGPDFDWAVGHGILELLQRDGNGLLFRALDRGCVLDFQPHELAPETKNLLGRLDRVGIEVLPKFATDEFGLANLYVVGYDREGFAPASPIMLSACGEACDPDRNVALRKALLEFCSARVRKAYAHGAAGEAERIAPPGFIEAWLKAALPSLEAGENRALDAMVEWAEMTPAELKSELEPTVFSRRSTKRFAELPQAELPDTRERGRFARQRLEEVGFDVLALDCAPEGSGIGVARAVVPGLEVETMSYHRIGERNTRKLIERDSPLIRFGAESETLRPVRLTPEALDRLGGRQPLLDTAAVDRAVGALYPLYREPEAHHVAYALTHR